VNRPDSDQLAEAQAVARHHPRYVDFIKQSYQETLEQLVKADGDVLLRLQGRAQTLELLLKHLTTR